MILGDSFTFGDEVSDDETYSYYLQEMLPHTEVINMGVHGYGHDQMLILLREEGVKYEPDIVILGFLPLDMPRNVLEFRDFAKPRFVLKGGELKLTGMPVPRPEDILQWDWIRPRIVDIFSLMHHKVRTLLGLRDKEIEDITTAILTEMIKLIESVHAIPILAYLPRAREIAMDIAMTRGEAYMFSMCQLNKKAKCFSTRPQFAKKIAKGQAFKSTGIGNLQVILLSPRQLKIIWLMKGTSPCRNCLKTQSAVGSCLPPVAPYIGSCCLDPSTRKGERLFILQVKPDENLKFSSRSHS